MGMPIAPGTWRKRHATSNQIKGTVYGNQGLYPYGAGEISRSLFAEWKNSICCPGLCPTAGWPEDYKEHENEELFHRKADMADGSAWRIP